MLYIKKEDPIEMLSLSNRSANALRNVGLETIGQLIDFPVDDLTKVKKMGAKSVSEVSSVILSLRQVRRIHNVSKRRWDNSHRRF